MAQLQTQQVRADLVVRLGAIAARIGSAPNRALAGELAEIRRIAHANGMFPAVTVSHALDSALARGETGPLVRGWLAILGDAIGSARTDRAACDTYAAACAIRYSG